MKNQINVKNKTTLWKINLVNFATKIVVAVDSYGLFEHMARRKIDVIKFCRISIETWQRKLMSVL